MCWWLPCASNVCYYFRFLRCLPFSCRRMACTGWLDSQAWGLTPSNNDLTTLSTGPRDPGMQPIVQGTYNPLWHQAHHLAATLRLAGSGKVRGPGFRWWQSRTQGLRPCVAAHGKLPPAVCCASAQDICLFTYAKRGLAAC